MSMIKVDPSNALSFSAFGDNNSSFGGLPAVSLLAGDRYQELDRRQSYYDCTQHDAKQWDFDGRPINPRVHQPFLGAERSWWVPLKMRRPSMTYRLGKIIVDAFTALLFGENRFPSVRVDGDEKTEDLLQTLCRVGKLPLKMIQARTMGGSMGTVGLSWCFREGKPRFEVHNPKNLFVHKWKDRLDLIPEHVSEVYLFSKVKWDGKAFMRQWYWFRRDWIPEADIVFEDVAFDPNPDVKITWKVDMEKSNFHGDGVCHLEWIQNLPTDEIDGKPDYEGQYEAFDGLDLLKSVINRGATLNLDPTVKLKMDRDEVGRLGIAKGSDNALVVGKDGDADYLELGGQSIEAGLKLVETIRRAILETAQCIVPDPHEVAAQGVSSVAVKMMYAPMTAKSDTLREQYGAAIERILSNISKVLKEKLSADVTITEPDLDEEGNPVPELDEQGNPVPGANKTKETPAKFVLDLPDKIDQEPDTDPVTMEENGEQNTVRTPRGPGEGGEVSLVWPPYFPPTPDDQGKIATALMSATGGKPFLSQETAVEAAARAYGADPAEEWKRVQQEAKDAASNEQSMMGGGDPGGKVGNPHQLPPGAKPKPPAPPAPPPGAKPPNPGGGDPNDPDQAGYDVDLTGQQKTPPFGG